jgi:hypothetical protein
MHDTHIQIIASDCDSQTTRLPLKLPADPDCLGFAKKDKREPRVAMEIIPLGPGFGAELRGISLR